MKTNALHDAQWQKQASYRQDNEDWLKLSFAIGLAILQTLEEKKMTQRELSVLLGCSPQYVNKIVKGSENLTLETICKIEKVLQIRLIEAPSRQLSL